MNRLTMHWNLTMHWKLIEGADGKKFLSMQWEVTQAEQTDLEDEKRRDVSTHDSKHDVLEQIVTRLCFEPGVSAVSWSVAPDTFSEDE